ncbi:MAG: iron-sulfur cluster assembly accessory protein, partial [Chloroflexota bacterium]
EGETRASDFVSEQNGVKIVIDDVSLGYLQGARIDYVEDVMGSGFKIENPNATSSCGCGHSFRTDGQDAPSDEGGCC